MIEALHHVAIIISSDDSLRFYELLGFTEVFRKARKYDTAVLMSGYGIELEIFIDSRHPGHTDGMDEPIGLRHFALRVFGTLEDEIERLRERFRAAGVELECGPIVNDWTGTRFCFIRDFDGLSIELRE